MVISKFQSYLEINIDYEGNLADGVAGNQDDECYKIHSLGKLNVGRSKTDDGVPNTDHVETDHGQQDIHVLQHRILKYIEY